jgi:carboxypeptidase C (cathepsin A)
MKIAGRSDVLGVVGLLAFVVATPLCAQPGPSWFDPTRVDDSPIAETVRSSHSGEYNGTAIQFDVIAGELLLNDLPASEGDEGGVAETTAPAATMFSTAYVRTDQGAGANRPVLFLFNGGPGASSSPLHLGIGPMRRPEGDDQGALVPNPLSPIDAVDMVFVDPVGTGFTRLLKEGAGEQFWGIKPDADSILLLIKTWLQQNGREASPVFIMGESYGGMRAAAMAGQATDPAKDVKLSGVLLLSPALDFSAGTQVVGNNLPYVFLLPSMAATAAYHGVVEANGRSYLQVFNEAAAWAQSEYAAALYQGNAITAADKQDVARQMSALIGLPAEYIADRNLRIDSWDFGDQLLAKDAMRTGHLDARAKGLLADYKDKRPPGNDPSMSGGNKGGRGTGEVLEEYYRNVLKVSIDRPYRTLNLDLNQKWDYGQKGGFTAYITVVPQLQEGMKNNPGLRVWVGGGVFDLGTPIMAARYATNQVDAAPERFVFAGYEGGHATFEHEESRKALCNDIRNFVAETLALNAARSQ